MIQPDKKPACRTGNQRAAKLPKQHQSGQKKQPCSIKRGGQKKNHRRLYGIIGMLTLLCVLLLGLNLFLLFRVIPPVSAKTLEHTSPYRGNSPLPEKNAGVQAAETGTAQVSPEYHSAEQESNSGAAEDISSLPLPDSTHAKKDSGFLIFVFDDAGHSLEQLEHFLRLPFPCTIAVLPRLQYSAESARRIRQAGKEVILHQPMQAVNPHIDPGPGAIQPQHSSAEIKEIIRTNLAELWPVAGMNNHEGSLITADAAAVNAVLDIVAEKNIFFLDSRTTAKTVVPQAAKERNMHIWERAVFIDNEKSRTAMEIQIQKGLDIAQKKGYAIMIGHIATIELAQLLHERFPFYAAQGFSFTTIGNL